MSLTGKSLISAWAQIDFFWFPSNCWIIVDQNRRTSVLYHNSLTWRLSPVSVVMQSGAYFKNFSRAITLFTNNCLIIVISEIFFTLLTSMGIRILIVFILWITLLTGLVLIAHWLDKNFLKKKNISHFAPWRNFFIFNLFCFIDSYRIDVSNLNLYDAKKKKLSLSRVIKPNDYGLIRWKNFNKKKTEKKKSLIDAQKSFTTPEN